MGAGKITVDLEARSDKWSAGIGKAEKDVRGLVDKTQAAMEKLTFQKGAGGFVEQFAKGAKAASEFATELRTGTGYADALGQVIDKIPIAGGIRQGGLALKELITGAKAARIEMEAVIDFQNRLADGYRAIAFAERELGKRGIERSLAGADSAGNADQTRIKNEKEAIAKQYREIEASVRRSGGAATPFQEREMGRLRKLNEELAAESILATEKTEDQKLILRKDYEDTFAEDRRRSGIETDEVIAGMEERALRRQGKGLESAIQANAEKVKHQVSDLRASVREHELEKMAPQDRAAKIADVEAKIIAVSKAGREQNAELAFEHDRKEQEQAKDNQEKLAEIRASGNVERLRIQDENLNARAEKEGRATRSHLADQAQVQEDYRKQVAELEKKFREEHRANAADRNDPTLRAQIAAADEERRQKLALLGDKGANEAAKNQDVIARDQRKLWEEVGTPAEKYSAHLKDINEQFEKFHDLNLKNSQIKKLDSETFAELKRLNPDHEPAANLYGIDSAKGFKVGGEGSRVAEQQLALMKKQADANADFPRQMRDVWLWVVKQLNGLGVSTVGIDDL